VSLVLFGSTQSVSFECHYKTGEWGTLGTIYHCNAQNSVRITSLDAAQIDSISGTHQDGYNSDNVEVFSVHRHQVHYFPRGLTKFFNNLKVIAFSKLTKLRTLFLSSNACIDTYAYKNSTEVQNIIKTVNAQWKNSEYQNLRQKVENLEIESKNLNSENLKQKLESLENEVKNSKFPNNFQGILKALNAAQTKKA